MGARPPAPRREWPSATEAWLGALERTARLEETPHRTLPVVIDDLAAQFGSRPALVGENEHLTYAALASRMRRYGRWAIGEGLRTGDVVGLLMENRPDYLAIWLGLTSVGVTVALLNTHLAGAALAHCVETARPTLVIASAGLIGKLADALPHLTGSPRVWLHGPGVHDRLDHAIDQVSDRPLEPASDPVGLNDRALLIYTSGTTGLPKAANVSHHRLMSWSHWFAGLMHTTSADRMFDCLPLYHSVGGVVAPGCVLVSGGSVVIRETFSASRFWDDVTEQRCTLFQYIGELCRYLTGAPPHPLERTHGLRLCVGNGLRADVWPRFQERFAIPQVLEFYAATEGTVSLYNVEGRIGAVGRVPPFMAHRSPAALIRHDGASGAPYRDPFGFCQRVERGEVGELIGRLSSDDAQAAQRFEGYTSAAESERKLLRGVFKPNDAWQRTGDLMRQDEDGFFHFVDRIGDTFRWKGENVATTEVAAVVGGAPGVEDVTVYGVTVPAAEGRAGMAALTVSEAFEFDTFRLWLAARLPPYSRPLFLRLREQLDVTETFKKTRTALVEEGFDPSRTADPLYVDDAAAGAFARIDDRIFAAIIGGGWRL